MLQIRLLGQFDIRLDGRRILVPSRAGQSLLAYLVLTAGTAHRREKLAGILWPDFAEDTARKNLRHELWRIRKAFSAQQSTPVDYLLTDEFTIAFNRETEYWLDVAQLERPELDLGSLISNLSLYQGELLPGFYEDWIVLERERVQAAFDSKMDQLLAQLVAGERWTAVQEQAERWLALGHTPEPAYRALMLAYGARGDMAKVSAIYQRCLEELGEKFGLEPSAETRALYDGLLKGSHAPSRAAQPSGTVTFLFTDIEESTQLLDQLGHQYAEVLAEHHRILRASIQKWNGREVDTQGDAFFVTFSRALDAVQCAADAQRALASHPWEHGGPLRVRMGLHTGEPLIASTGYVGMDVHRAARIGDAAHGGQVLLSQTTRELVLHDLPRSLTIRDLGEHRLKDLKFPTPIYQLVVEGLPDKFPPLRTRFSGVEAPTPGEPPFKGLQYFEETDSDLFFGREVLTAKLVKRLRETQFLSVVIGASGSGKSSLVRAGLIPALKKGRTLIDGSQPPEGSTGWQIHVITPTAHPLQALAMELTRGSESVAATATLIDDLMQDPRSLNLFLARRYPKQHTLLVLDQFEELFTLCRDEFEREAFIDNLLATLRQGEGHTTLVLTLRADFYAHLAQYPELRDAVAQQQEYIGPMTMEELRRAIEEPARRGHWAFEPGLVDLILRDVGDEPGALPLLSHALLETWKRRAGHTLTLKGYADAGGVRGAIAHTAESVYQNLVPEEQSIARDIFLRLTELGEGTEDTRRRASLGELLAAAKNAADVRNVLNLLAQARLITLGEDTAEVAHEALIREWPALREWLNQDRESLRLHRHLTEASQEWELLERDPGALYRGSRLSQAREWALLHPDALNNREKAFLEASNCLEQDEIAEREAQRQRELEAARKLAQTEHARAVEQTRSANRLRTRNRVITSMGSIAVLLALLAGMFGAQSNRNALASQNNAATAQVAKDHAFIAQGTAQAASTQAIADFTRSEAQRLAADAKSLMQAASDPQLIALLSLRSINTQYTDEGDAALTGAAVLPIPKRIFSDLGRKVYSANFSPDDKYLVVGSYDGAVRLFDTRTGQELREFTANEEHRGVKAIFSPDGQTVYAASNNSSVWGWDLKTGQVKLHLSYDDAPIDIEVSPDGSRLLIGSVAGTPRLLNAQTGETICQFSGHTGSVWELAFSPDGRYVATSSVDKTARLWKTENCEWLRTFSGHTDGVASVDFSPDGKYLATGSWDKTARLWDVESGQELRRFIGHACYIVRSVRFSPDGKYLLTGNCDKTARLWDVETGNALHTFSGQDDIIWTVAFSHDGRSILTGSHDGTVWLWDLQHVSGEHLQFVGNTDSFWCVAISPDGRLLAAGGSGRNTRLWDVQTGKELNAFDINDVNSVAFSPDGRYLLLGAGDSSVWLWDVRANKMALNFVHDPDNQAGVLGVAFSPDGKYAVTSGQDAYARRWDLQTGGLLTTYGSGTENIGGSDTLYGVAYSPDGNYVLTGGWDGVMRLYNAQSGKQIREFKEDGMSGIYGVAFSPDNRLVISGSKDMTARVWDMQTGKVLQRLSGHTAYLYAVTFSPDGKLALTSSADNSARLWDLQTGRELRRFTGHKGPVEWAVFAPDGKTFATASDDGTARIWSVDYHDTMKYLCSSLLRDFTNEERQQYHIQDNLPTCPGQ